MKTRIGFVSNSSSSSFCIFGCCISTGKPLQNALLKMPEAEEVARRLLSGRSRYIDACPRAPESFSAEEVRDFIKDNSYDISHELNFIVDDSYVYFGEHPFLGMKDDETKSQFIARVTNEVREIFGPGVTPQLYEGTIYC